MFNVLKFFILVLWATYSKYSYVKANYEAGFDFVIVVGVKM